MDRSSPSLSMWFLFWCCLTLFQCPTARTQCEEARLLPSVLYAEINDTLTLYCVQQVECSEIVFSFNGNDYTASNGYEDFPGFQSNSLPVNVSQDPCNISFTFIRTVAFADESEVSCSGKAGSCRQITTIHSPGLPDAVSKIEFQPGLTTLNLTWEEPFHFPGFPIISYQIYLFEENIFISKKSKNTNNRKASFQSLSASTRFAIIIEVASTLGSRNSSQYCESTLPLGEVISTFESVLIAQGGVLYLSWVHFLEPEVSAQPVIVVNDVAMESSELENEGFEIKYNRTYTSLEITLNPSFTEIWNCSTWQWRVRQYNAVLCSNITYLIIGGIPLVPPHPVERIVQSDYILLEISPPFSHFPIQRYKVQYYNTITKMRTTVIKPDLNGIPVEVHLTKLTSNTNYTIKITAQNKVGESEAITFSIITPEDSGEAFCDFEEDNKWGIQWQRTFPNHMDTQACLQNLTVSFSATRVCAGNAKWRDPDVSNCSTAYITHLQPMIDAISEDACYGMDSELVKVCLSNAAQLINQLGTALEVNVKTLFPLDLVASVSALFHSIRLQEVATTRSERVYVPINNNSIVAEYLKIFNELLDLRHLVAWMELNQMNVTFVVEELLASNMIFLRVLSNATGNVEELGMNYGLKVSTVSGDSSVAISNAVAEFSESAINTLLNENNQSHFAVSYLKNIASYLPKVLPSGIIEADTDTDVIMVQTSTIPEDTSELSSITPGAISVEFNFAEPPYRPLCVLRDLSQTSSSISFESFWSATDVTTISDKWSTKVTCVLTKLGAVTVLTNIQGPNFTADPISVALYIGGILNSILLFLSMAALIAIIIRDQREEENKRPILNVAQLNYALVHIIATVILMSSVESARNSDISSTIVPVECKITASLSHYAFLVLYMWVLNIAIALFCMHAELWRKLVNSWWILVIVAYGLPIIIVVIATAVNHYYYGSELGCWLSHRNGTVWAFGGPAVVLLLITYVFLVCGVVSIIRNKSEDATATEDKKSISERRELTGSIILYMLAMFPMLSISLAFGFAYLATGNGSYATVFAVVAVLEAAVFLSFQMLRLKLIRRFWSRNIVGNLKKFCIAFKGSDSAQHSASVSRVATGRYIADGKMGVDLMESTDFVPVYWDTGFANKNDTYQTDSTYLW